MTRNFFKKAALVSTIAATGLAATAAASFAQVGDPVDETVNFTGDVGSVCTFGDVVTDGELVILPDNDADLTTWPAVGGVEGSVMLTCTGSATLSVSLPIDNGSVTALGDIAGNPDVYQNAVAYFDDIDGNNFTAFYNTIDGDSPTAIGPIEDQVIAVGMNIINNLGPIPAGTYDYNVIVTAAPF